MYDVYCLFSCPPKTFRLCQLFTKEILQFLCDACISYKLIGIFIPLLHTFLVVCDFSRGLHCCYICLYNIGCFLLCAQAYQSHFKALVVMFHLIFVMQKLHNIFMYAYPYLISWEEGHIMVRSHSKLCTD